MANNETFEIRVRIKDDGTTATMTNIQTKAKAAGVEVSLLAKQFKELQNAQAGSTTTLRMTGQEFQNYANSASGASKASGAAAASAMELGRVISDAPYGIRGMANNLSQLASNLLFMAQTTDQATGKTIGFVGSLKQMGKALLGPLGLLIAIQSLLAFMETMSGKLSALRGDFSQFADKGVTETTVRLKILEKTLNDTNISLDTKVEMLNRAKGEFEELNDVTLENGKLTTAGANALQNFTNELMKMAKAKAVVEIIEDLVKQQVALQATGGEALGFMGMLERFGLFLEGASWEEATKTAVGAELNLLEKLLENYRGFLGDEGLLPYIFDPGGADPNKNVQKIFKNFFLDLTNEINKFQNERKAVGVTDPLALLGFEEEAEQQALVAKFDAIQKKIEEQQSKYDEQLEKGLLTQEQYDEASLKLQESTWQNILELDDAMGELLLTQQGIRAQKKKELDEQASRDLMSALAEQDDVMAQREMSLMVNADERLARERENIITQFNYKAQALQDEILQKQEAGLATDALEEQMFTLAHQRELALTDIKKQEAENRIETASQFGAAMGAISDLLGEQTQAGKIFGIAAATIDTYVAGAKIMADPTLPAAARIPAMIAVIARGLANVKKIMEVKVPGKSDTGGGGGATTFNPNFNVVGQSGQNQLAETVAGAANDGTRAYVVYSDIQEAGAIEANAVHSASFG